MCMVADQLAKQQVHGTQEFTVWILQLTNVEFQARYTARDFAVMLIKTPTIRSQMC